MNTALPIMVIVGDRWSATCNITGGAISDAIFSTEVYLADGYTLNNTGSTIAIFDDSTGDPVYEPTSGITLGINGDKCIINDVVSNLDVSKTSNSVVFKLPSELTKYFKPGKYSYNISVVEAPEDNVQNDQIVTPVYTNAFNVFARVNAINPVQPNS